MVEYFAGFISGISQVIVGHPFDTIIVHKQLNKSLKISNIYKGIQYPLLTSSIISSISFGLTNNIYKYTKNYYISGMLSGIITSFIINPIELYKIKSQISIKTKVHMYTGIKQTILREMIASSIYFGTYYSMRDNNVPVYISGATAGVLSWIISFPIDTIKCRIQSGKYNTSMECIKKGNLYKGIQFCILRAAIVNSISFYIYNKIKNLI